MTVVLITSQQNRRSGSVYTFEQLIFKVHLMAWASSCWPGAFFVWKFMREVFSKFWGSFTCQQGERGHSGFTSTEEEPEKVLIKLQGFLRYLWCPGCPRDTGMPAQQPWFPASETWPVWWEPSKGFGLQSILFSIICSWNYFNLLPFLLFPTWTQLCVCSQELFVVMIRIFELAHIFTMISNCCHKRLASFLCFRREENNSE